MRRKSTIAALAAIMLFASLTVSIPVAMGASLGDLIKGGGIVFLVDRFGGEINKFVNKMTLNHGVGVEDRTNVVPIISVGQGGYVGAAQVSGPAHLVDKVKAVAQIEANMSGKTFRVKALVPVESKDVVKDIKRVGGVGVSAIIDIRL